MKPIPKIEKYMTTVPVSVELSCPLKDAVTMMQEEGFRHLPVKDKGTLVGILSMTDVNMAGMIHGADFQKMKVADAYHKSPLTVATTSGIDEVCTSMARNKFGCALVTDNNHLVGIFTWIDALQAIDDLFHTRLK